ncbi:MAG: DUF308 domain-containing protein [Bacilli bacterium]|nr:DUF308 domain-containing protein [Bacilli bacterium]
MICIGVIVLILPIDSSSDIIAFIIGILISIKALKGLVYYFTSAKNMIGGRRILINNIILLDFGLVSFFVTIKHSELAMLYFIILLTIFAGIDILRAIEIKNSDGKRWIFRLIKGIITLILGILCMIFIKSPYIMATIFGIAWLIYGLSGAVQVFKRTSIGYIAQDEFNM